MPVTNRTNEFFQAVEAIRQRNGQLQALRPSDISSSLDPSNKSEFARNAAGIARDISATAEKLERLTKLAKRRAMFDDRPAEINELTYDIKEDISRMAGQIRKLEHQQQSNGRFTKEHASNIVATLQSKLAGASTVFKDALETRSQNLAQQPQVQQSTMMMVPQSTSPLYNSQAVPQQSPDYISIQMPMQQELMRQEDTSRNQAIEGIEKTIQDLAGLFQQLTTMVSAHDDMVRRIDYNVEDVESNVMGAQQQLTRYMRDLSGNRWLMAKMFMVVIFFFLLFVLFFA